MCKTILVELSFLPCKAAGSFDDLPPAFLSGATEKNFPTALQQIQCVTALHANKSIDWILCDDLNQLFAALGSISCQEQYFESEFL